MILDEDSGRSLHSSNTQKLLDRDTNTPKVCTKPWSFATGMKVSEENPVLVIPKVTKEMFKMKEVNNIKPDESATNVAVDSISSVPNSKELEIVVESGGDKKPEENIVKGEMGGMQTGSSNEFGTAKLQNLSSTGKVDSSPVSKKVLPGEMKTIHLLTNGIFVELWIYLWEVIQYHLNIK